MRLYDYHVIDSYVHELFMLAVRNVVAEVAEELGLVVLKEVREWLGVKI